MPKAEPDAGNDAQLAADVRAFAAQLGLGSGSGDGAFDDFAPQKASQRIGGAKAKPAKQQQQQNGGGGGAAAAAGRRRQDDGKPQQQGGKAREQQQQQGGRWQKDGGKPHGRDGRDGKQQQQQQYQQRRPWQQPGGGYGEVPPAPEVPNAKSIMPKDEPTVWHEAASTLPPLAPAAGEAAPELVQQLRKRAERLLLVEEQAFEQNMGRRSSADAKWLQQVRRSGTTADKVAAMSVLVQDGAAANLPSLDGLLGMAGKKGGARAVVGSAMDALKELFTTVLLPDRKLRFFEQQPLGKLEAGREGERRLLYWLVEDAVKKRYATFVEALEASSRDNLEFLKDRAVKAMYELLVAKPEQEARLLGGLVNKLGDPDRKLASKVGYLLTRLLAEHPGMGVPVVREIERFIFRPGLADRARYYAVVYLNQMVMSHRAPAPAQGGSLAKRLIDVYFTLFKMVLDGKIGTQAQLAKQQSDKAANAAAKRKKGEAAKARAAEAARAKAAEEAEKAAKEASGEMDGRMLSALITGVRRAFPYVPPEEVEPLIAAHADALFRLVHARSFGVATQALLLLFQLMSSRSTVSDRFYRALYAVLGSPEIYRSTKAPMFLSLLVKALKADVSAKRAAAFAKRLLQVAQEAPPHFACGCLLLTSELLKARPALWGAVLQAEETDGDGLERFQDAPEDGPAAAAEQQQQQQQGAARRARRAASSAASSDDSEGGSSSEEEELGGLAAGNSSGDEDADLMPGLQQQRQSVAAVAAAAKAAAQRAQAAAAAAKWPTSKESYDMNKREPQFSNADRSCLWELTSLAAHVHPSVAAMARTLLAGQSCLYSGDPLRDLTLAAFLEKFVQKKAKAGTKGDSAMQPLAGATAAGAAAGPQQWAALAGAQTQALAMLAEKEVRPDDLFFHKYYSLQAVQDKAAAARRKKGRAADDELLSDAESEDSDAADEALEAEEDGGDGGIGADPDRAGTDYDYADLAAAMDSGDDSDSQPESGSLSGSDAEGSLSGSEDEEGGGSEEGASSGEEPQGASFSDMSGSEDEEGGAGGAGGLSSSGGEEEEEGAGGSDASDASDSDSEDDGFEAALAADDLSDDEDGDSSCSSDDDDDAAADAEVAALIRRHRIKPLAASAGGSAGSDEELNPFELAEATSSDDDAAAPAAAAKQPRGKAAAAKRRAAASPSSSDDDSGGGSSSADDLGDGEDAMAAAGGQAKRRKRGGDSGSIFASADEYLELIEKDLADGAGLDDGTAPASDDEERPRGRRSGGGRGGGGGRAGGSGRAGGRGGKQQQQQRGGGGGGRGAKRPQQGGGGRPPKRR